MLLDPTISMSPTSAQDHCAIDDEHAQPTSPDNDTLPILIIESNSVLVQHPKNRKCPTEYAGLLNPQHQLPPTGKCSETATNVPGVQTDGL